MKYLFTFLATLFKPTPFTGVNFDDRPESEKDNDIEHEEVYGATVVQWTEKIVYKQYSTRNQTLWGSSCLAHATAKANEVENGLVASARDVYDLRSNKNGGAISAAGMIPYNALQIWCNNGITSEKLLPSNDLDDLHLTQPFIRTPGMELIEDSIKGGDPVSLPIDMDTIASAFDQGRGIILCLNFTQKEWVEVPFLTSAFSGISHGVAIEDRTIYKGKKAFVIGDSWLLNTTINGKGQRILTEDFILARCKYAGYRLKLPAPVAFPKPQHIFTQDLSLGDKNSEVVLLQDRLKYEGLFPNIESTGYFGAITKKAVIEYQKKHNIEPAVGYVGKITRGVLNST